LGAFSFLDSLPQDVRAKVFWSSAKFVLHSATNYPGNFSDFRAKFSEISKSLRRSQDASLCALAAVLKNFVPENLEGAKEVSAKYLSETDDFLQTVSKIERPDDLDVPFFDIPIDDEFLGERKFCFVADEDAPSDLAKAFRNIAQPKNIDYSVA